LIPDIRQVLVAMLLALTTFPIEADANEFTRVDITSPLAGKGPFTAQLLLPDGAGPFPAIVALHGCGGLFAPSGKMQSRETDWARRLVAAGYVVLLPDSFAARGLREICTVKARTIHPRDRADDAAAAAQWLAAQPFVDQSRLALIGWSNGGSTVLWTMRPNFLAEAADFKVAIAFYPGCRVTAKQAAWRPRAPLTILIGSADDWTPAAPCRDLAKRDRVRLIEYPGAYHDFDAPNSKVRVRRNVALTRSGTAHVGTNPAARAAAIEEVMATLENALRQP
jgi:dienelactone hydrolase